MLALLWPDVVSMSRVSQLTVISRADAVSFGKQNVLFGSPLRLFGNPRDHRAIQDQLGAQEGRPWGSGWISISLGWISGPHFDSFWLTLDKMCVFFHACFQVMFLLE